MFYAGDADLEFQVSVRAGDVEYIARFSGNSNRFFRLRSIVRTEGQFQSESYFPSGESDAGSAIIARLLERFPGAEVGAEVSVDPTGTWNLR